MKLSNQAMGAIMMALQKSLLEQTDIVPVLRSFEFSKSPDTNRWGTKSGELMVINPPTFNISGAGTEPSGEEKNSTTGSD
jgi:hypothetical protein